MMKYLTLVFIACIVPLVTACHSSSGLQVEEKVMADEEFPSWQELEQRYAGSYFFRGPTDARYAALTFDDGPSFVSERVLDLLDHHGIKATFFWQGNSVASNVDIVRRALEGGHTIANHSWDHPNGQDTESLVLWQEQVQPTNKVFNELVGHKPLYYRPPFGVIRRDQIEYLAQRNLMIIAWSISSLDWDEANNSPDQMVDTVISELHPGAIVLFHDYYRGEPRDELFLALDRVILEAIEQGYTWVTIDELLSLDN